MNFNLSEKLKSLRKDKNCSQEKLAKFLNVSFQAVSKWENQNACPDISLLPDIARFFGITVDELLQVELIDEKKLFEEYSEKTYDLFRTGHVSDTIPIWKEAYQRMPNNVHVKEMLMSAYFDTDKKMYQSEIIELGTEIYHSDAGMYYKGQAINELATTYAENGNEKMADYWASRSYQLMHSQEFIYMNILSDGKELLDYFSFINYWYLNKLFYMCTSFERCEDIPGGAAFTKSLYQTAAKLYETVFPNDDMGYEDLERLYLLHRLAAEEETNLSGDENTVKTHLTRAFECAVRSMSVEEHCLTHPLLTGWRVSAAPSDNKQIIREMKDELSWECFDAFRNTEWFKEINNRLSALI